MIFLLLISLLLLPIVVAADENHHRTLLKSIKENKVNYNNDNNIEELLDKIDEIIDEVISVETSSLSSSETKTDIGKKEDSVKAKTSENNNDNDYFHVDFNDNNDASPSENNVYFDAIIVGAGTAGLSAAYKLQMEGMTNYKILEAANDIGGRVRKDTTFVDYPIDVGASFIPHGFLKELEEDIIGAQLPTAIIHDGYSIVFKNYTYYDLLKDYFTPPADDANHNEIEFNCEVYKVDYSSEREDAIIIHSRCGTFVADKVIITVPLSVLQADIIEFVPSFNLQTNNPRTWWKGFKIFIEFDTNFYGDYFCFVNEELAYDDDDDQYYDFDDDLNDDQYYDFEYGNFSACDYDTGQNFFWDYTYSAPDSVLLTRKNLLAGYFVGDEAIEFFGKNDDEVKDIVLMKIANKFNVSKVDYLDRIYRRYFIMNWTNQEFIWGAYSSSPHGDVVNEIDNNKIIFAGEAFPVGQEQAGWVYTAMHSGFDAAFKVLGN